MISVVMPVFDAAATLQEAIESIRAQTEQEWELIAIDDGSTDDSPAILRDAAGREPRLRVLPHEHRGLVPTLNAGLAAARGRFIARMDADDVAAPERLARQRRWLDEHPDVGVVATRVVFEGDRARRAGFARHVAWSNALLGHDEIALARFVEAPVAHPSAMFRRELVDRFGGYADGDFPEDYELWLRWLEAGVRFEKLPDALLRWRDRDARLSRTDPRYAPDAFYRVKAIYLARWLATNNPHHPKILVWGAGRVTRRRAGYLTDHGVHVSAFVDIDPRKIGRAIDGAPVIAPEELPPPGTCFVVPYVASVGARMLIETRLRARGYRAGQEYVLAA